MTSMQSSPLLPFLEKEGGLKLHWQVISVKGLGTWEDVKLSEKMFSKNTFGF